MEENNNENIKENAAVNESEKPKHVCFETHCWKKCLAMLCAAFLGGFLAFYFVTDQALHRYHNKYVKYDNFEEQMLKDFNDMDRMYLKDLHEMEKRFDNPKNIMPRFGHEKFNMPFLSINPVKVKTEMEDNALNIIVCLKPFQNDENKVNYDVKPGKITVYGSSETRHKNIDENVSFSQDFLLPQNADIDNVSKTKDGKKLIISIPIKNG